MGTKNWPYHTTPFVGKNFDIKLISDNEDHFCLFLGLNLFVCLFFICKITCK